MVNLIVSSGAASGMWWWCPCCWKHV